MQGKKILDVLHDMICLLCKRYNMINNNVIYFIIFLFFQLSSKLNNVTSEAEALNAIMRFTTKENEKGSINNVGSMTFTHRGPVCSEDTVMPHGVPQNFQYIKEASNRYVYLKEGKREFGEAAYKKLFDELVMNKDEWDCFFRFPANASHAGDSCMCLGELAGVYKGRRDYDACEKVLVMMEFLLVFIKKHNMSDEREHDMSNFIAHHEYQILTMRYDTNLYKQNYKQNVSILREGVAFEEQHDVPQRKHSFRDTWKLMADSWNMQRNKPKVNVKRIDKVSDEALLAMIELPHKFQNELRAKNPHLYNGVSVEEMKNNKMILQHCANCNQQEPALGDYKKCNQCKAVVYCGRKCQLAHWKAGHKKVCAKKK